MRELTAIIDCDSPHIVTCYGAFYSVRYMIIFKKGEIFILMEYMDLGSLDSIMQKCNTIIESILMIITSQVS